jgi:hypothetical protein
MAWSRPWCRRLQIVGGTIVVLFITCSSQHLSMVEIKQMRLPIRTLMLTAASTSLGLADTATAGGHSAPAKANPYVAGDMHNHNTCVDGSVAAGYSIDRSVGTGTAAAGGNNFDLDWFTLGNHGGSGNRDCRFSDTSAQIPGQTTTTWSQTLGQTIDGITIAALEGTPNGSNMWRWQSVKEVEYPIIVDRTAQYHKVLIEGLEWIAPGHEHIDVAVISGQHPQGGKSGAGNADKMAEFEYRFDRADTDAIGPVDASSNPIWTGKDNVNNTGTAGHAKSVTGVQWLQANYPLQSYAVPTHTERQGPFSATSSKGFNIEHFRDYNNAGPTVAFGIESPGHMAQAFPGGGNYGSGAVGGGTYGLAGVYTSKVGGLWDGMLGEGRNYFIYVSSDWHNRGVYGAGDGRTSEDFIPGEYSKLYLPNGKSFSAQSVVDGMRSGNSYSTNGDIVGPDLVFRAKAISTPSKCPHGWFWLGDHSNDDWKTMGETLVARPGQTVTVEMQMTIPTKNNSPYSFNNPLLLQDGIKQPLNKPSLDHVDLITGDITGVVDPSDPNYAVANVAGVPGADIVYNPSTKIAEQIMAKDMKVVHNKDGSTQLTFRTTFKMGNMPFYIRARGTNMPLATPKVTNSAGEPLIDTLGSQVPCADPACPDHLFQSNGVKLTTYDVYAYSNLWFYANPIFVRPVGSAKLLVEKNADLAQKLASKHDHGPWSPWHSWDPRKPWKVSFGR